MTNLAESDRLQTIKLPEIGKTMRSGTVRKWLKKPGDAVARGELILQLDSDNGLVEVESPVTGRLGKVIVAEGKTAKVHEDLAEIEIGEAAANNPVPAQSVGASAGGKVIPILMPKAGQSMEEGVLLKWHVKPGAVVKKGDVIFEIETDKATMDVESPESGRLARIVLEEGQALAVLQPVAYLADNDADVDAFVAAGGWPKQVEFRPSPVAEQVAPSRQSTASAATVSDGGRVKASPAARRIAQERGVDLSGVAAGTGPGGRILSGDVPASAARSEKRKRMSQMRKAIARGLSLSKQTIPHFYVRLTIDAAPLLAFYQAQKALYPCSINDVIVQACARLLRDYPAFRSRIDGDELIETPSSNIGIAVGMDDGLVVPVVVGAEQLSLKQIAAETKRLATSARNGKIEGSGQGSFTITNLGMFGTEEFAAIINPPEAAILAVGAARDAVIVKNGALTAGKTMTMTLSADHRVVDGMLAAKFLQGLKDLLENPQKLNV
jgi:pyruvate dehydrogenase E2 component (dihydrolipoamide acetyltransferase)